MSSYEGRRRRPEPVRRWSFRAGAGAAAFLVGVLGAALQGQSAGSSSPQGDVYANGQYAMYVETFCKAKAAGNNQRLNEATNALKDVAYYRGVPYVAPVCPSPSPTATSPSPSPSTTSPSPSPSTTSPSPTNSPSPTVSPSPSPTVSPSPTGGPLLDCMRQADKCGWPTTATAGIPAAIKATLIPPAGPPSPTPITLAAGTVLERVWTNRCYTLGGNNITIRYVLFRPECGPVAISGEGGTPRTGIVIDHVELDLSRMNDGLGRTYPYNYNVRAISSHGFTLTNSYAHSGGDVVHYGGDIVIRDNLFDIAECTVLPACSGMHIDALHSASGHPDPAKRHVLIQHNTIIMWGTGDGHPNSAIINGPDIPPYTYPQDDVQIVENLMAGGGAVVYTQAHPEDPANAGKTASIWRNRISDLVWPRCGKWGPFYNDAMDPPAPGRLTNVYDRTGLVIPLGTWG